jgi:hypothetical protein
LQRPKFARLVDQRAAEHERLMEEREAQYREMQAREAAIERQIKQQANEFHAQNSAWVQVRAWPTSFGDHLCF